MKNYLSILILNWKDITNPAAGGGTYYTHRVAKHLFDEGHKVTLLCANYQGGQKRETIDGVDIIRIGNKYTVYIKAPLKFLKDLRNNFDLVIDEINIIPWLTPLYAKVPKIAFIHQTTEEALFEELNKAIASLISFVEKTGMLFYRKLPFITVSKSVKAELVNNGVPRKSIFVVYPGIDTKKYKCTREEKSNFPLILYLGRLKKYKGVQHLVRAMGQVVTQIPEAKLSIVGMGNHRSKLERLVAILNLQNVVSFHGYVSEEEKIRFLKKAWILAVPSIKEGFGIVVIEAAACGTPAIGTNTVGTKDAIVNGQTGFLVPYGKPEILSQKICEILSNDELRNRLSKNASKWSEEFSWDETLQKFETIIEQETARNTGD